MIIRIALCFAALLTTALAQPHEMCSEWHGSRNVDGHKVEDYGTVASPLRGWVGYTNTGDPVVGMKIDCFSSDGKTLLSSTLTNEAGEFSFPKLSQGTFLLRGRAKEVSDLDFIVSVSRKSKFIACPIAEAAGE